MPDEPWSVGRLRGKLALVIWQDGQRRRYSLGTDDPVEARRRAPSLYAELMRPKGKTVADLWTGYQAEMQGRAVLVTMAHNWKALRDRFGPIPGDEITIADCRAHVAERRAICTSRHPHGISQGTIHTELGHLRMILLWGEKHRLISRASHIERPAKPKAVDRHLTVAQVQRLIEACDAPHLALFVHLAYATAGRAGAILGLRWDRVDFERDKINLEDPDLLMPHKGRAVVPMTRTLKPRLLTAKAGAISPYVVEWAGRRVGSVKKGLAAAAERAGLPHVSPHMLRHSSAVRQAERGVPMEEIASHLGHSDTSITRRVYARFSPEALSRSRDALELDDLPSAVRGSRKRIA